MIPVQLTIEGLYSYRQRQTIDFSALTDAGLFGIFGATGSGKSSILEAISYALYGDTERLNSRKRTYNMMNLKSNRTYISFDFYNHENERYRVTREFKRNTKQFGQIRSPKTVFYHAVKGEWKPMEHTDAEKIIGLNYHHFKRTIIIPQGQFREFLDLKPKERTQMMRDIFNLHQYDLQYKAAELRKENQSKLDQVEGQLQTFNKVTKEEITEKEKNYSEATKALDSCRKTHNLIEEKFQQLKHLKQDFDFLQKQKAEFEKLEIQRGSILQTEKDIEDYERIYKTFYHPLIELKKNNKAHQRKKEEQEECQKELEKITKQLQQQQNELQKIESYFNQLSQKKTEAEDLRFLAQIAALSYAIEKGKNRKKKGGEMVQSVEETNVELTSKITQLEKEITTLKAQKPASKQLRELADWYSRYDNLKENLHNQKKKVDSKKNDIQSLIEKMKAGQMHPESFEAKIKEETEKLNEQEERLNDKKESLKVREKLSEHAHDLKAGEACPLCGALDHPNIAEAEDVSHELSAINISLKDITGQKAKLQEKRAEFKSKMNLKASLEKDLKQEKEEVSAIEQKVNKQRDGFKWEGFHPENPDAFRAKQEEADQLEKQIEIKEKQLNKDREAEIITRRKVEKYKQELNKIEREEEAKQAQIKTNKSNLTRLKVEDYSDRGAEELAHLSKRIQQENERIEQSHQQLTHQIHQLENKTTAQSTKSDSLNEQIESLEKEIDILRKQIDENIRNEVSVSNINEVRKILSKNPDIAAERKKIEQFKIDYEKTKSSISELEKKLKEISFSQSRYEQQEEKWKDSKQKLQEVNDRVVACKEELIRLKKEWQEKQALQKEHEKQQKRAENLAVMFNLFKGSGFVQYVSSLYLSQLCNQANARFHPMTRNQLSLQINEDNDFEIVDYLNEGKSRSVKTLSGGQAFQVSLSLALALAESVQSQAKAEKKFFFIDEGFGTQDEESINIIFETLLHLNRENKIVGIISHVEALKDRIPQSLLVEKDPEKGSLIYVN